MRDSVDELMAKPRGAVSETGTCSPNSRMKGVISLIPEMTPVS